MAAKALELNYVTGFTGDYTGGLHVTGNELVYAVGSTVIIETLGKSSRQFLLDGHTDKVTALAVSRDGRYILSGQQTHMDHPADIILWDAVKHIALRHLPLHKTAIRSLAFSPSGKYFASIGSPDDGRVTIWDTLEGKALAGVVVTTRASGDARVVAFSSVSDVHFATGGDAMLRLWTFEPAGAKLTPTECNLGALRRDFTTLSYSSDGTLLYAGTTSGDVVQLDATRGLLKSSGPEKRKFGNGVTSLVALKTGALLVGGGDGTISLVTPAAAFKREREGVVEGAVTALALRGEGHEFFAGTTAGSVTRLTLLDFAKDTLLSAFPARVLDVAFPSGTSKLFGTCGVGGVRVWAVGGKTELLRIDVPSKTANCIVFSPDGKLIYTGWDDGAVRAFMPESGKLAFELGSTHTKGVSALAVAHDSGTLLTGGGDGKIRAWAVGGGGGAGTPKLLHTLSQHTGTVSSIMFAATRAEFVSAGIDGACLLWDAAKFAQKRVIIAATQFAAAQYRPDDVQILATGSNRKVAYYEVFDGSLIREVEVTAVGTVKSLDIGSNCVLFAIGGTDRALKVYNYAKGERVAATGALCADITRVKISPDCQSVLAVTGAGAVYSWKLPA